MNNIEIRKGNKKAYKPMFCQKTIKYQIRNSNGGLLGGSSNLEGAKEIAARKIEEYKNDPLNKGIQVWIEELYDYKKE